jgi:AcrR family transcriptional regulator
MDARLRRSQERLHAAVLRLAGERPVADLSVTEVAAAAEVHRSTFYEHAESPGALLEAALVAELDRMRADLLAATDPDVSRSVGETTRAVLDHVARYAEVYRRGLGAGSGGASLHPMLSGHFRETSRRLLADGRVTIEVGVDGVADDLVADVAIRFIADGTVGVIEAWLEQPELTVDDVLRTYEALLPAWWPHA